MEEWHDQVYTLERSLKIRLVEEKTRDQETNKQAFTQSREKMMPE